MKEISINMVAYGDGITEDGLMDALIEMAESRGWSIGGGVCEMSEEEKAKAQAAVDAMFKNEVGVVGGCTALPRSDQ